MNPEREKALTDLARRNPFWVCLAVFPALAGDQGSRLANLLEQRQQLRQAQHVQTQNSGALAQAQQLEGRLRALSIDLLQMAATNAPARQIVQEFNIQWTPPPGSSLASTPAPVSPDSTTPTPSTAEPAGTAPAVPSRSKPTPITPAISVPGSGAPGTSAPAATGPQTK